jgi:phosphoserine aminotransferase
MMLSEMYKWLLKEGGVEEMDARAARKAGKLYAAIDKSHFYTYASLPCGCRLRSFFLQLPCSAC